MKTIAEQLNIKEFPFTIRDKNGNLLYYEHSDNFWFKYELDEEGNERYFENSDGFWSKYELDENGDELYFENSDGLIRDNRVKEMTKEEAEKQFKIKIV